MAEGEAGVPRRHVAPSASAVVSIAVSVPSLRPRTRPTAARIEGQPKGRDVLATNRNCECKLLGAPRARR